MKFLLCCFVLMEQPPGVRLVRVQTSPNDRMLWALDSRCNVHVRTGITEEMPVGTAWEHIPGTSFILLFLFHLVSFALFLLSLTQTFWLLVIFV